MARKLEVQLVLKDAASAEIKKFDKHARTSAAGVQKLDTSLKHVGTTATRMKTALGGLFAGLGAAMVLRDMTRTIAGFEQSMAVVKGVTRATAADFAMLRDRARELGATTVFTAQQSADAMVSLSRAGFDASETLAVVGDALNLAAAGNIELAEAADYTAGLIRTFNLVAQESTRVVDVMVNAANNANTDVRQFAEAMKYAGPIASSLGKSIEETAAAIGVLADRNIKANLGGTNLRGVLLGLASATDAGQAALQKMGITVQQLDVGNRNLADVLETLGKGFDRITNKTEKAAAAEALFGRRNIGAALILADSSKTIREKIKLYEELRGEARRLADEMQNTLGGSFKALRSAVEELYLATGDDGFAGSLKSVVDTVTGTIRVLAGMNSETANVSESSRQLARVIDAAATALIRFVEVKIVFFAIGAARALWTMVTAMSAAAATSTAFTAAMAVNPLTAFAVAVSGIAFAFRYFSSDAAGATGAMNEFNDSLVKASQSTRSVEAAIGKLSRARLSGNMEREAQAIRSVVANINTLADTLQGRLAKAGRFSPTAGIKISELLKVDPDIEKTQWYRDLVTKFKQIGQIVTPDTTVHAESALKALDQAAKAYGIQLSDVKKRLVDYKKAQDDARESDRLREQTAESLRRYQEGARKGLVSYLQNLDEEIGLLKILNTQGEIEAELARAKMLADKGGLAVTEEQIAALRRALELRKALEDHAQKSIDTAKREARVEQRREYRDAGQPRGFGEGFAAFAGYDVAEKKWRETAFQMADVGNQAASAMFNAFQVQFFDPMTGAFRDLGEIARDFATTFLQSLAQIASQQAALLAIKGLSSALGLVGGKTVQAGATGGNGGFGIPGVSLGMKAKGGVYDRTGEVTRFAAGGVVKSPTVFPFASGIGLMGEAGPEAIMPLRRGPGGRLGVEGGGGGTVNNISVDFSPTINNPKDGKDVGQQLDVQREKLKSEMLRLFADGQVRRAVKGATR